jgi:putative endonuclease
MQSTLNSEEREAAEQYLQSGGFRILDRDWQCPHDRIDLLAVERDTLVAFVVQTRKGTAHRASPEPVSEKRRRSLRSLAAAWLTAHGVRYEQIRIDLVTLVSEGSGGYTIEHTRAVG